MDEITQVGLVGLGTAGVGIAAVLAASGRSVVAVDVDQDRLDGGRAAVERALEHLQPAEREAALSRIVTTTDLTQVASADLVVEAVTEDAGLKRAVLAAVAAVVGRDAWIVTATSGLSVTELATAVPHPDRFAGLRVFLPVPHQRTVEVVHGLATRQDVVQGLVALVGTLGDQHAVVIKDSPGFLVGAMLVPYLNDVVQALDDELASAEDLDLALRLGLGYRVGPLEMLDAIGLDSHLRTTEALHAATGDVRYAPPPLLRRMVAAQRLGAANGHGFSTHESRKDDA